MACLTRRNRCSRSLRTLAYLLIAGGIALPLHAAFTHPGCLSTQADLERMASHVAAADEPWKGSWDRLVGNTDGFLDDAPLAQTPIRAGGGGGENYIRLARDAAKAYQLALRYHGSGERRFADKAVGILNAWASTHDSWEGDSNVRLRAGLYGYQLACGAELLRDYPGWERPDFKAFQGYMRTQFLPHNRDFLQHLHGTVPGHYWANWNLANLASMMAIAVLCDDDATFKESVDYFQHGQANESIARSVVFIHPNGLGQWQESGRDQGHALMGPQLLGVVCEIAWNQGVDLYGTMDNRVLATIEYVSKFNLGHEVPFVTFVRHWGHPGKERQEINRVIADRGARGSIRPGWDLLYNHYVHRRGLSAPWTARSAERARPEGGGFNYGTGSGGFDGLGFTTLTHSREPIAHGAVPAALRPTVQGRQVTLSWSGSPDARSYNVKRATASGGPYTRVATVASPNLHFTDPGLTAGTTYHYVVSANTPGGEGADSTPVAVTADRQLHGTVIGTDGSYRDSGAEKSTVFDGYLGNYFDPPGPGCWVGLDLGEGVNAVVTGVRYAPRSGMADRMIGGKFQGSSTPDFSRDVVDLLTVTEAPEDGVLTEEAIDATSRFRYLRYVVPADGWCSVAEIQFLGDPQGLRAPGTPAGLTSSAPGDATLRLSWQAVTGADGYRVRRLPAGDGPEVIVAEVSDTRHNEAGLQADFPYRWVVTAFNSAGESPPSDPLVAPRR